MELIVGSGDIVLGVGVGLWTEGVNRLYFVDNKECGIFRDGSRGEALVQSSSCIGLSQ